ncbi:MAG TPA: retropepsin-like aspartic protease [Pirellulaceae bacterium]|nr:retropepsin-like aspartic protease [Pirellulaceae bacterium]
MAACGNWRWGTGGAAWLALVWLCYAPARAADDPAAAAEQLADRYGLVKITGRVWGLPVEQQLRSRLKRLPELRERIVTAQKELDERIAQNDAAWKAAELAIAALNQRLAQLSTTHPQRGVLLQERAKWSANAVPPAELAGRDIVRGRLARLGQDRATLAIDLVWIRSTAGTIADRYRELASDHDLTRLIQETGDKCRLGPARNYQAEVRKLEDYVKLAFAPHAPIYFQSGRVRVTAVVNDAACVTFSWSDASDAVTFLPASVVHSAGIAVPVDARRETLQIDGRTIEVREVFLSSLRLGGCRVRSVAAFVLPPEAEDLGAQLTSLALSPWRVRIERQRLRLALSNDQ